MFSGLFTQVISSSHWWKGFQFVIFLFPFLLSIAVAANCSSSFIHWKKPKHTLSELGYTKIPTHAPCFLTRATPDWNSPASLHQTPNCALRWAWLYLISVSRPHAPPGPPPLTASWNALQPKPLPAPRACNGPIGEQAYVSSIGLRPCNQVLSLKIHGLALVTLSWVGGTGPLIRFGCHMG